MKPKSDAKLKKGMMRMLHPPQGFTNGLRFKQSSHLFLLTQRAYQHSQ